MASLIDRYVADLYDYAERNKQLEHYHTYALQFIHKTDTDSDGVRYIPDEFYSFIGLLSEDDANAVISKFLEITRARLDLLDVKIISAVPLTFPQRADIENKIVSMFGKGISLVTTVDSSLIGGLRIVVGHMIIDNTVKTKLAEMKKNVYKEVYLK